MNDANPLNPQRVFWELSPRLPEKCIIACDTGSGTNWYARDVKIRRGMMASVSGYAGDDGSRHALRDRGEIRLSRPARYWLSSATARCR